MTDEVRTVCEQLSHQLRVGVEILAGLMCWLRA